MAKTTPPAKSRPKTKKKVVLKTQENDADVSSFIKAIPDESKRQDAQDLLKLFKQVTKEEPKMWGSSIVGFGTYVFESPATGRTGDWYITGFSPRKQNMTVYIMTGFGVHAPLMKKLGKFKTGGSCLYFNKLSDLDPKTLKELVSESYKQMKKKYSGKK